MLEAQQTHVITAVKQQPPDAEKDKKLLFDPTRYETMSEAAFIERNLSLIEQWDAYQYLDHTAFASPLPGETTQERDFWRAVMARMLHNSACECLGTRPDDQRYDPTRNPHAVDEIWTAYERAWLAMGVDIHETTTPTKTTAWSGATNLPVVLGYVRKIMPKVMALRLFQIQPLDKPTGRYFTLTRNRHNDGSADGDIAARAGWSYRSWAMTPGEAATIAKSITFTMTSDDVSVVNRKLKTETSIEVEQDLRAYHGMDAVAMLAEGVDDEMANELDEELLYTIYREVSVNGAGTFQYGAKPSTFTYEEWDRRILEVLQRASDHVLTYKRVAPNNLVFGTDWSVRLGNLKAWVPTDQIVGPNAIVRPVGTLSSTWECHKAVKPWPTLEAVLVYKGTTWTDASFIYLPYVPIMLSGEHFDPDKQVRTLSWISRYAIKTVDAAQNAYLKINEAITNTSYPAWTEYVD